MRARRDGGERLEVDRRRLLLGEMDIADGDGERVEAALAL